LTAIGVEQMGKPGLMSASTHFRYHEISLSSGSAMTDMLIRDVPVDIVAAIDASAQRLGVSRVEYVRRQLIRESRRSSGPVTVDDFRRLSADLSDLGDSEVMSGAWR
jgi:hypothetical protein